MISLACSISFHAMAAADLRLGDYISPNPGPIFHLESGRKLSEHQGLWNFTVGQNARIAGLSSKAFVAKKSRKNNAIYVVTNP
jgi:tRNA U34 2-thiouridine synthase MnmA/TrmU